jgi:AcrR family transcriptional regulator
MPTAGAPYHHGDLRAALIDATEALLAEKGPDAFSLREVARRAGVSPAAPAHHFGDAAGLLTAVATLGFEGLTQALEAGNARGGDDPLAALREQGVGYVRYALQHPGRFRLMFRQGQLHADAELERHGIASFEVLARGVQRAAGDSTANQEQAVVALWSLVHGYAHLAIAGRFAELAAPHDVNTYLRTLLPPLLDAVLAGVLSTGPSSPSAPPGRT